MLSKPTVSPYLPIDEQSFLLSSKVSVKSVADGYTNIDATHKHSKVQRLLKGLRCLPVIIVLVC